MITVTLSALRAHLSDYLNLAELIVVTQQGRVKAVLCPVEDEDDVERLLLANHAEFMNLLDEADRRISKTGGIPHDQFWEQVNQEAQPPPTRSRKRRKTGARKRPAQHHGKGTMKPH
jgi:prevent-host-death family protein